MHKLPTFQNMMGLIDSHGISGMSESIQKRARWKKMRARGYDIPLPVADIVADHIIAYNQYEHDDGTYHPEYVTVPENLKGISPWMRYIENNGTKAWRSRTIPMADAVMLNLSRRNSGRVKDSNGFIDKRAFEEEDLPEEPEEVHGFTANINSGSHRVISSLQDWIKFVQDHGVEWTDNDGTTWMMPDWQSHVDNGTYSIEWNRAFFDEIEDNEKIKALWDAKVGGIPTRMMGEPQIGILHPDAIRSTQPYRWADTADKNSQGYYQYKDGTYQDQASWELRAKRNRAKRKKGKKKKETVESDYGEEDFSLGDDPKMQMDPNEAY